MAKSEAPSAPPELTHEAVLAYLNRTYPLGVRLEKGQLIPALDGEPGPPFKDFKQLSEILLEPKELVIKIRGRKHKFQIRELTGEEVLAVDAIGVAIPPKKKAPDGKPLEDPDYSDPTFSVEADRLYALKRAMIISFGMVGLEVEGTTAEEKKKFLDKLFPPNLQEEWRNQITRITGNVVEAAAFT